MAGKQRISYVPLERMTDEMRAEMERCATVGTPRPESQAVRAHQPDVLRHFSRTWNAVFKEGLVEHRTKEICRVYVSQLVNCEY